MEYPSEIIKELVARLIKIPGIGQRSAIRMVISLLKQNKEEVEALAQAISMLTTHIKYCKKCQNISDHETCNICSNNTRDHSMICVVEDIRDVIALENTNQYKGLYYVLGGLISPMEGIGPGELNIDLLIKRIEAEEIKEVIFALNANIEGDTTMFYIAKLLKDKEVGLSVLSRGISVGGELEYADELTLGRSLIHRTVYSI